MNILEATADPHLFARWFKDRKTWEAWFAYLAALFALPMTSEQLETFRQCTGRDDPPKERVTEAYTICGRRAGKSFILALISVYLACFFDWRQYLTPGERGYVMIIAADRKQARTIFRYIKALVMEVPMLARLVKTEGAESIELTNNLVIEIATCSYRTVRGRTIIAALLDEAAFFPSEDASSPDVEVINAVRPGMASVPGSIMLIASSPYARKGALWDAYNRYYGKPDAAALVWKAATRTMNATVPQRIVDEAIERDASAAAAEFLAEFRNDCEALVSREVVLACIKEGVFERAPERRWRYCLFVDVSGGVSDSSTACIAHREGSTVIIDKIVERKAPHSPEVFIEEIAGIAKNYRCTKAVGDRYSGNFASDTFRRHGLNYEASDRSRSELYRDFLPLLNSRGVDLLDHDRMLNQIVGLERRVSRTGRETIDHGPSGKDDVANAVAGAACNVRTTDKSERPPLVHEGCGRGSYSIHSGQRSNSR